MIHYHSPSHSVRVFEAPSHPDRSTQDQWLVQERGGVLRIGVMDGVTPGREFANPLEVDAAQWAANACRTALQSDLSPEEALTKANSFLYDPSLSPIGPETMVVTCEVRDESIDLLIAGDCQAWVRESGEWCSVFSLSCLREGPREEWAAWRQENSDVTLSELIETERELLRAYPEKWLSAPLGRWEELKVQSTSLPLPEKLILASDGARFEEGGLDDIPTWLDGLRAWEVNHITADPKPHDDITVVEVTF